MEDIKLNYVIMTSPLDPNFEVYVFYGISGSFAIDSLEKNRLEKKSSLFRLNDNGS